MPNTKRRINTALLKTIVTAVLVALITIITVSAICGAAISKGIIGENSYTTCAIVSLLAGALSGSWYATQKRGEKYLLTGLIFAAVLITLRIIFSFNAIENAKTMNAVWADVAILVGAIIGGLPKSRTVRKRRI